MTGTTVQVRRDSSTNWATFNPIAADGELCFDKTNGEVKIGDGVNTFSALPVVANVGSRAWIQQLRKSGVKFNVNVDQSAAYQAAIDAYTVQGKRKLMEYPIAADGSTLSIRIDSPITKRLTCLSIRWNGLKLDASHATNPSADQSLPYPMLKFIGQTVPPYNIESMLNECDSFLLEGSYTEGLNVDGLQLGDSATTVGHSKLQKIKSEGFRDGWIFGDNTYITEADTCFINKNWRRGYSCDGSVNAGERLLIIGGSIADNKNSSGDAVGLYMPAGTNMEVLWDGPTCSYTDIPIRQEGGTVKAATHFENGNTQPFAIISTTSGYAPTVFNYDGGSISHGALGTVTEPSSGRDCLIYVSGNDRTVVTVNGINYSGYGRYATRFVKLAPGCNAQVSITNVNHNPQGGAVGRICDESSDVHNGDFGTGTLEGFSQDPAAGVTMNVIAAVAPPEDGSAFMFRYNSTGTNSAALSQTVDVKARTKMRARVWLRVNSRTAGSFGLQVTWFSRNGTQIGNPTTNGLPPLTSAVGWTLLGNDLVAPKGAKTAEVSIYGAGFQGDANAYNFAVWERL